MEFHINIDNALNGLLTANDKVRRGIELYGQTASLKMEAYAKKNRQWKDHTHLARDTMKGISGWGEIGGDHSYSLPTQIGSGHSGNGKFIIGVTGNMPYSVYLELAHGKKYAILYPAVNALAAETLRGFAAMMNALH